MTITFYKDFRKSVIIPNVHDFTKCSTGDVIITYFNGNEITIKREQYDYFGCCVE